MKNKILLEKVDAENWDMTIVDGTSSDGFKLSQRGKEYFIESPNGKKTFKVRKSHVIQRVYNFFEEPTAAELRKSWQVTMPSKIKEALEVSPDGIRQIYLDIVWAKKSRQITNQPQ